MYEHDDHDHDHAPDDVALRAVPDLAGTPVEDASGLSVGAMFGALAEADTGLIRYIDLSLERLDRHVLVPIGHTRIREVEREGPRIRLRAALLEELEQIPPFPADVAHIDDPFERALLEAYGRSFHGERYYAHPSYDHSGVYAGDYPVVQGEEPSEASQETGQTAAPPRGDAGPGRPADAGDMANGRLTRLAYLPGWRVARGEPDVRQWPLLLDDGTQVQVQDLVVEPAAEKVRYLVVRTSDGRGARLLPIGFLQIDGSEQRVRAPGLDVTDLDALPEYEGGGVSREQEDRVCAALRRRMGGRRRYQLPDFRPDHQINRS
jgi:hypothetical protein